MSSDPNSGPPPNPQPAPQPAHPEEQEIVMNFETLSAHGLAYATASVYALQDKGLRLLTALISEADEHNKTHLGALGAIPLLAKVMAVGIAPDAPAEKIPRLRELAAQCIWMLCIGHVDNKKKANPAIEHLVKILKDTMDHFSKEMEELARYLAMALWGICYGIPENKEKTLAAGGVAEEARLLTHPDAPLKCKYAASGAIWHVTELPQACQVVVDTGCPQALADLATSKMSPDKLITPCLTLAALSNFPSAVAAIKEAKGFEAILAFTRANNPVTFETPFVWTTLKPLNDLINSSFWEVQELGCFLSYTVCTREDVSKLFQEGVVDRLKVLAHDRDHHHIARISRLTLTNLNIPIDDSRPHYDAKDMESWLKALGMEEFAPTFAKRYVTFDALPLLKSEDFDKLQLPVGALRKVQFAAASLRTAAEIVRGNKPVPPPPTDAPSCLVCLDAPREYCFVPCGHVVCCEKCAQIVRARNDSCVICRTPVREIVKPFFV